MGGHSLCCVIRGFVCGDIDTSVSCNTCLDLTRNARRSSSKGDVKRLTRFAVEGTKMEHKGWEM